MKNLIRNFRVVGLFWTVFPSLEYEQSSKSWFRFRNPLFSNLFNYASRDEDYSMNKIKFEIPQRFLKSSGFSTYRSDLSVISAANHINY